MRKLADSELKHRYYWTLTRAIAFDILAIQEGIRLLRLHLLGERIFILEGILFILLVIAATVDNCLAFRWLPKNL